MGELTYYNARFTMKSKRVFGVRISNLELDWIFDKMFGRTEGTFQNISNMVINITEIETMEFVDEEVGEYFRTERDM